MQHIFSHSIDVLLFDIFRFPNILMNFCLCCVYSARFYNQPKINRISDTVWKQCAVPSFKYLRVEFVRNAMLAIAKSNTNWIAVKR